VVYRRLVCDAPSIANAVGKLSKIGFGNEPFVV